MAAFRVGIFWKLFAAILAGMACSLIIITALYLGLTPQTKLRQHVSMALLRESERIGRWIEEQYAGGERDVSSLVAALYQHDRASVTLYGPDGIMLATSAASDLGVPARISADTVEAVLHQGFLFKVVYPRRVLAPVVLLPVDLGDGLQGIVRCDYPLTERFLRILPPWMIEGVVLGSLLICILLLSRYLTRPIRRLTQTARDMAQGNFTRTIPVTSRDEVGELAQAMLSMAKRIASENASRRELFADISHELRSPLARMLTDAEILLERQTGGSEQEQRLGAICTEIENLNRLIGDLALLAKTEYDEPAICPSPNPLQDVVLHALSLLLPQIEGKRITLLQDVPEEPIYVMLDPVRIGQVISNLVMNALRYTPDGGTLEVGVVCRGIMAEVWLRDTGEGIPEDKLPHVFDRFFRVDRSRSRTTGGSGLGLAIVKKFVEAHGGQVSIESRQGEGTRVGFTLPMAL